MEMKIRAIILLSFLLVFISGCGKTSKPESIPDVSAQVSVSDYFGYSEDGFTEDIYYDVSSQVLEYDLPPIDGEWIDAEIEAYNYYIPTGDVIGQYGEYF